MYDSKLLVLHVTDEEMAKRVLESFCDMLKSEISHYCLKCPNDRRIGDKVYAFSDILKVSLDKLSDLNEGKPLND